MEQGLLQKNHDWIIRSKNVINCWNAINDTTSTSGYKSGLFNEGSSLMEAQGQRAIDCVLKWVVTGAHADVNSAVPLTIKRRSSIHNLKRKNHDLNIIWIMKTSRFDVH